MMSPMLPCSFKRLLALVALASVVQLSGCCSLPEDLVPQDRPVPRPAAPDPPNVPDPPPLPDLPSGTDPARIAPPEMSGFRSLESDGSKVCGLRDGGTITCWTGGWGLRQDHAGPFVAQGSGELAECGVRQDGTLGCPESVVNEEVTEQLPSDGPFTQLAGGQDFGCALRQDGTVTCWGRDTQVPDPPEGTFRQIAAGRDFICGLTAEGGRIACSSTTRFRRLDLPAGPYVQLGASSGGVCGLTAEGRVRCSRDVPTADAPTEGIEWLTRGGARVCGQDRAGEVRCWGHPSRVITLPSPGRYRTVAVAQRYSCALLEDRTVQCWGDGFGLDEGQPSIRPPDKVVVRDVRANPRAKNGDVYGVEVSFLSHVSGGSDGAKISLAGWLLRPDGSPVRTNGHFPRLRSREGGLQVRSRLRSFGGGSWRRTSLFFPYFAMDLAPGEQRAKVAVEATAEVELGATPREIRLEGFTPPEIRFRKPPAKTIRLGVSRIEVAEGRYDTVLLARRTRRRPDLAWVVHFRERPGIWSFEVFRSNTVQDSYSALWDLTTPPFPLSEGDRVSLTVLDIDVAKNDNIARFSFSLEDLQKAAASRQPLSRGRVHKLELGTVEVR